jgi:pimeloyl-ACP methyl ester carboxylesterase
MFCIVALYAWAMNWLTGIGFLAIGAGLMVGSPTPIRAQAVTTAAWLAETLIAPNDTDRYPAGIRLRQLERAWHQAQADRRERAIPVIQMAVRGFFAGRAREVSAGLDRAVGILEGMDSRPGDRLLADSLDLVVYPALMDNRSTAVLEIRQAYSAKAQPTTLTVVVTGVGRVEGGVVSDLEFGKLDHDTLPAQLYPLTGSVSSKGSRNSGTRRLSRSASPGAGQRQIGQGTFLVQRGMTGSIPLDVGRLLMISRGIREGDDFILRVDIRNEAGQSLRSFGVILSVARDLDDRLAKLQDVVNNPGSGPRDSVIRETIGHNLFVMKRLAGGPPRETDRAASGILRAMEAMAALPPETSRLDALRAGLIASHDHTLTLSTLPVTMSPALFRIGGDPAQLTAAGINRAIVAIHGAGGSENMFHDAYGLGALAAWCRANKRLMIAPKIYSPADDFWGRLDPLLDTSSSPSLVLLGHSMGSLASIEMARQRPASVAAIVAISVGSREGVEMLRDKPVMVVAGKEDFGRYSSRPLFEKLRRAGAKAQWLETPSEHLMVVADALGPALKWITQSEDKGLKTKSASLRRE